MPSKKGGRGIVTKSGDSKGGGMGKKESKGGTAIKVRHILCEKQVFFFIRTFSSAVFWKTVTLMIFYRCCSTFFLVNVFVVFKRHNSYI